MNRQSGPMARAVRFPMRALAIGAILLTCSCSGGGDGTTPPAPPAGGIAAPAISYAQTSHALTTGVPLAEQVPTNTGGAATWSANPPLPAGLTLSTSDGSIRGTPTTVVPATTHVIRAVNSAGSSTANLTFGVESGVLLDLGHAIAIERVRYVGSRILSVQHEVENPRHWVLWNAQTGQSLAQGDVTCQACMPLADLAGSTFFVRVPTGFELRAAADGHIQGSIAATPKWWMLAADGSYLAAGDQSGVTAWSPDGTVLVTRAGDYSKAAAFAAAGELRIALGAAGADRIETIAIPSGAASVSPPFSGAFDAWFGDGERFLSRVTNNVWVYSKAGVQQDFRTFTSITDLGGWGPWFWGRYRANPQLSNAEFSLYAVGASANPVATYGDVVPTPSNGTLALRRQSFDILDLTGPTPSLASHPIPRACSAYTAKSSSQWICGDGDGIVFDASGATPKYFGLGRANSIAGGAERVAVSTALGPIVYFNARTKTEEGRIDFGPAQLAMSDDGSVLAAVPSDIISKPLPDRSIKIFALPSGAVLATYPYAANASPQPIRVYLSGVGNRVGKLLAGSLAPGATYYREVTTPVSGSPVLWQDSVTAPTMCFVCSGADLPVLLSPDGTSIAVADHTRVYHAATRLYENGQLVSAVQGWAVGWIDDNRLLVNVYNNDIPYTFRNPLIVNAVGQPQPTPPLREIFRLQRLAAESIYSPDKNLILSLATGGTTWSSPNESKGLGAVAGGRVVFAHLAHVRAEPY